jgi:hypothetical protein
MKDMLINVMVSMMPLMKPFMWFGIVAAVLGLIFIITKILFKGNTDKGITWSSKIVFSVLMFFILAQITGQLLSMPPAINFGDSTKFEFILISFWQISLAFFIAALIIKFIGKANKSYAS